MQLFWRQGYEATSLQDLLREMRLSKSSFYQAFGSKHALFGRCIDHYRDSLARGMQQQLEAAPRHGTSLPACSTRWPGRCRARMPAVAAWL